MYDFICIKKSFAPYYIYISVYIYTLYDTVCIGYRYTYACCMKNDMTVNDRGYMSHVT